MLDWGSARVQCVGVFGQDRRDCGLTVLRVAFVETCQDGALNTANLVGRQLAEELHLTNLEMRAGGSRDQSLRNLALRTGVDEVGVFAAMLTQADKFGTSIGESLRVFSDDLRHKRQVRAEEAAAKVPTKMLFPLVLCIFPSIIMVIMGPAVIQIIRSLLPSISGTQG